MFQLIQSTLTTYNYNKSSTITNAGNYTTGVPNVYLSDTSLGMTITVTEVSGYITGFTVTNPGNILFSSSPNVVISGGGGAGATAYVCVCICMNVHHRQIWNKNKEL